MPKQILRWLALLTLSAMLLTIDVSAKVLLFDDFESKLDLKKWWGSEWNPKDWKKHVYPKDGVLYLNQKKSGSDYVALSSIQKFTECIIYWEWIMIEWTGGGDCGGALRQNGDKANYWIRWNQGNCACVRLANSNDNWAIFNAKDGLCQVPYDTKSKRFVLKAAVLPSKQRTALYIWDVTKEGAPQQIAKWELKDDSVPKGNISFGNWKFGIVGVDNALVTTPEHEAQIFAPDFNPQSLTVQAAGKLPITWGFLKSEIKK